MHRSGASAAVVGRDEAGGAAGPLLAIACGGTADESESGDGCRKQGGFVEEHVYLLVGGEEQME